MVHWRKFIFPTPSFRQGQVVALLCALSGMLVRLALTPVLHGSFPFIFFLPAILVAALLGGAAAGLGSLVYSVAILVGVFFSTPRGFALSPGNSHGLVVFAATGAILIAVATLVRALVQRLVEAERRAQTVAREASHRTRNVLVIVQSIARQTARGAASVEDFTTILDARLGALARAQDLDSEESEYDLESFVTRAAEPFEPSRFQISGPTIAVPEDQAPILALMLYELATNAVKHGSLFASGGIVIVTWRIAGDTLKLRWEERGGPLVVPPDRRGFGTRLMTSSLAPESGGVTLGFEPQGLVAEIALRLPRAASPEGRAAPGEFFGGFFAGLWRRIISITPGVSVEPPDRGRL